MCVVVECRRTRVTWLLLSYSLDLVVSVSDVFDVIVGEFPSNDESIDYLFRNEIEKRTTKKPDR